MERVVISVEASGRRYMAVLSIHPTFDLAKAEIVYGKDEAEAAGKCLTWMLRAGVPFTAVEVAIH